MLSRARTRKVWGPLERPEKALGEVHELPRKRGYQTHSWLGPQIGGALTPEQTSELDQQAKIVTRYLLFAHEAPLPPGGVEGDAVFKTDFLRNRREIKGASLKDFDLRSRLFKYRCSYMVYSTVFAGLPPLMKERIYRRLGAALGLKKTDPDYAYMSTSEKKAIRRILSATLSDLPRGW